MSATLTVRRFGPDEWQTYRRLRLQSLEESPDAFGGTLAAEQARPDAQWAGRLESAAAFDLPLVAEVDGQGVGLVWGKIDPFSPDTAHVYQMWVAPSHRGLGAGRKLLEAVVAWGTTANARNVELGVTIGDSPAMRLYLRLGFEPTGEPTPLREGSRLLAQTLRLKLKTAAALVPNSVRVGGVDKASMLQTLRRLGVQLNAAAETLFGDERFAPNNDAQVVEIATRSVAQLGFAQGATYKQLMAKAGEAGLGECPLELGPHLRMSFMNQPEAGGDAPAQQGSAPPGALTVASVPLDDEEETPKGFYLRCFDGALWLRGYRSWVGHVWEPRDVFVFCRQFALGPLAEANRPFKSFGK